jgi:hypothetical protein
MINLNKKNKCGYALMEIVFYISLFAIISILVINSMIIMMNSFKETKINFQLSSGANIAERISREIKQADSIFSITGTSLSLNTKDINDVSKKITFSLVNNNIQYSENDILIGNLNDSNLIINNLFFSSVSTNKSSAVRFTMSVSSAFDSSNKIVDFQNTLILRNNY